MNCIKCSCALTDGAKFCKYCGQNQSTPVSFENPQSTANPQFPNTAFGSEKSEFFANLLKNKLVLTVTAGVLGVVLLASTAFGIFYLNNDSLRLGVALQKTASTISSDAMKIAKDTPVYDHVSALFNKDLYVVLDDGRDTVRIATDLKDDKFSLNYNGFLTIKSDGDDIVAEVPFLGSYGTELEFELDILEDYSDIISKVALDTFKQTTKNIDVTSSKETVYVDSNSFKATKYSTSFNTSDVNKFLQEFWYNLLTNKDFRKALESDFDAEELYSLARYYDNYSFSAPTFTTFLDTLANQVRMNTFVYANGGFNLDFYVDNGIIVKAVLSNFVDPSEEIWIGIANSKKPLEKMFFFDGRNLNAVSVTESKNELNVAISENGYTYGMSYDYKSTSNNLQFYGFGVATCTLDSSTKNVLRFYYPYENITITSTIGGTQKSDFAIGNYTDIRNAGSAIYDILDLF